MRAVAKALCASERLRGATVWDADDEALQPLAALILFNPIIVGELQGVVLILRTITDHRLTPSSVKLPIASQRACGIVLLVPQHAHAQHLAREAQRLL